MVLLIYLAKASLLLALFWVIYKVFLEAETYHRWKRIYLFLGYALSLILPLISFTKIEEISYTPSFFVPSSSEFVPTEIEPSNFELASSFITEHAVIELLYIVISMVFFIHLMVKFYKLLRFLKSSKAIKTNGIFHIETSIPEGAFSFLNYIVYDPKLYSEAELSIILAHEKTHVTHKHSLDILFAHLYKCAFWFNPFAWLYQKSLVLNLEYEADAKVVTITTKKDYQLTLYNITQQHFKSQLQHSFHQSPIKKRIAMLNKDKQNQSLWKLFIVSPLLVVFFLFFQVETKAQVKELGAFSEVKNSKNNIDGIEDAERLIINGKNVDKEDLVNSFIPVEDFQYDETSKTLSITTPSEYSELYYTDILDLIKESELIKGTLFFKVTSELKVVTLKIDDIKTSETTQKPLLDKNISLSKFSSESEKPLSDFKSKNMNQRMVFIVDGEKTEQGETVNINTDQIESIEVLISPEELNAEGYNSNFVDEVIKITTNKSNASNASKNKGTKEVNKLALKKSGNAIYLVDGKETDKDQLNQIKPEEIKSIDVVKSAKVIKTAGYNPKKVDGLIKITTKKNNEVGNNQNSNKNFRVSALGKNDNTIIYKVDGEVVNYKKFAGLDPEQIQSMVVVKSPYDLKEAGYDPKKVDGIIIISTKKKDTNAKALYEKHVSDLNLDGTLVYLVDGEEVSQDEFKKIKPNQIESLDVLKNASGIKDFGYDPNKIDGLMNLKTKSKNSKSVDKIKIR